MDNIENYILGCEDAYQDTLRLLRQTILKAAPTAIEKISWGVPTYYLNGFLVQFSYYKKHIGFYCSPKAIAHFQKELSHYKTNQKNSIHFQYNQPLPLTLIHDIVIYRIKENKECKTDD